MANHFHHWNILISTTSTFLMLFTIIPSVKSTNTTINNYDNTTSMTNTTTDSQSSSRGNNNTGTSKDALITIEQLNSLRARIIDSNDHRFRPLLDQTEAINISVDFFLHQILAIDEVQMQITVSCEFHFAWKDEVRRWRPDLANQIIVLHLEPKDTWRPLLFFYNSVGDRDVFKDDNAHLSLRYDGSTQWNPGVILATSCELDLRKYPFDKQQCFILIQSSGFADEIHFHSPLGEAHTEAYSQNGAWSIVSTSIKSTELVYAQVSHALLNISITLQRNPDFYLMTSVFPVVMLSTVSLMVFVLPRDSGERAGFSVTVLLALSLVQAEICSQLPETPNAIPYIVMYLICLQTLSWLMVVSTICVLLWHFRQAKKQEVASDDESQDSVASWTGSSPSLTPSSLSSHSYKPDNDGKFCKSNLYKDDYNNYHNKRSSLFITDNQNEAKSIYNSTTHDTLLDDFSKRPIMTDAQNQEVNKRVTGYSKGNKYRNPCRVGPIEPGSDPTRSSTARGRWIDGLLRNALVWFVSDVDVVLFALYLTTSTLVSIVFFVNMTS